MSTGLQQSSPRHSGDNRPPPSMDHPSSPMRPPTQDGYHPTSPPDLRGHHDPSMGMGGYRGPPPPGYGGAPPGYPPYPSYGAPPQNGYGSPPPSHGYPPPGGYPPHHHPAYGYGYPPGPRPPYGYGYEGGYPGQQSQSSPPFRGGAHPHQGPPPPQQQHSQRSPQKGSPPAMPVGSSGNASPTLSPSSLPHRPKTVEHVEVERLRFAAAAEITHEDVKPIRSDFHFFVMENKEKCRKLSEEEVRKSTKTEGELDAFLVNSNLNTRMMKLWEDLKSEERGSYMVKEEEDRLRFMEEDEIASRHCATLTARGKSPRSSEKQGDKEKVRKEERQESETKPASTPPREAPTRKMEESNEGSVDESNEENSKKEEEGSPAESIASRSEDAATIEVDSVKKRLSPPSSPPVSAVEEDTSESPSKRKRVESAC